MKKIKILSFILIIATLMLSMPIIHVNASSTPDYATLKRIHNRATATTASIEADITSISKATGSPAQNESYDWLNPFVYKDYGIIAYGVPHGDTSDDSAENFYVKSGGLMRSKGGTAGEYKYLGVNASGDDITNDKYFYTGSPGSTFSSVEDYKSIRWQNISGASDTWSNISDAQVKQLAHTNFTDDDYITQGEVPLTLKELLGDNLYNKAYVQVAPSLWSVTGSVRLEYNGSNWNTVTIPPMAPNTTLEASIYADTTYTMTSSMEYIDIPYKITGIVGGDIIKSGMLDYIEKVNIVSSNATKPNFVAPDKKVSQTAQFTIRYTRGSLKEGKNNERTLKGNVFTASTYKTDIILIKSVEKDITIFVEPKPQLEGTGKIEVRCYDADTNEEIVGTGNTLSSIKYNTTTTINIPSTPSGYKPAIGAYKSINGTPNKSLMDKPATAQKVAVTKDNNTIYVFFYYEKLPPTPTDPGTPPVKPIDPNQPPTPVIINPYQAKAGDDVEIDGSKSYDIDGTVESYEWDLPGTYEETEGVNSIGVNSIGANSIGYAWYPKVGIYDIYLTVTDDKGDSITGSSPIEIITPNPLVELKVSADKMKENRKIMLDVSSSTSSKRYPIDWSLTEWKIEPASGTGATGDYGVRFLDGTVYKNVNGIAQKYSNGTWTNTGIAFNTVLNGQKTLQFQARDSGQYNVTVSITNTCSVDSNVHYSNSNKREIEIVEDLAPVADFTFPNYNIRDIDSPNGPTAQKYGIIPVTCSTNSPDKDPIGVRKWVIRYDSDNDGNFDEEAKIYPYTDNKPFTSGTRLVVNGDKDNIADIYWYEVGDFPVELEVFEDIQDNETVKELLIPSDFKSAYKKSW